MAEHTIEPKDGRFAVYEWSVYERSSVLAGQTRKRFVDWFDSEAEARKAYPKADIGFRDAHNTFNHLPGESDPVPGGMYPDDYDDFEEEDHRDRALYSQGYSF